ncbi:MAG: Na(+)-translocating NADH-quinone reductase subunit A [Shewanella sp.]|nr:Na(+)-translocating NADH-quinone reductase subunit A [Shewanella sp.]MCF1431196.1 Na(+)-translocating NADH-quinone reductase subunit A [Shewanella sp.]MCF1438258.1 Na(+)-translocating NADH-quinone reductase subunit A [Shewanella sp.]MCF1456084.1 Na(+)-translocating NADH-quinone reductase subunit A [Shewanella sp.]
MADYSDAIITVTKGLDVPIAGAPRQEIEPAAKPSQLALLGKEYVGLKPSMLVEEGQRVVKGQPLFEDKSNPGVCFTAPGAGTVSAIHRGEKRLLLSVVIDCDGPDESIDFGAESDLIGLSREQVQDKLLQSGLWTALRTRPFSRAPKPGSTPAGLFVTAIDTNPLAADPRVIIDTDPAAFRSGMQVLTHLTDGPVFLCQDSRHGTLPGAELDKVQTHRFQGPHPAGLVGTHIHLLMPVSMERQVWHIGYQDVMAIGRLFTTGKLDNRRIVALAGPNVLQPRLIATVLGAKVSDIVKGELKDEVHSRVVSGSVLSGHTAQGAFDFLGRFHPQISVITEDDSEHLLPWVRLGRDKFSITRTVLSRFLPKRLYDMTTHTGGAKRAMMAFGQLDRVMPLDILPTLLVRDLVVRDTDEAQLLGALELDEEDLALCTFVCPSKYDFGQELRACLTIIEKEG